MGHTGKPLYSVSYERVNIGVVKAQSVTSGLLLWRMPLALWRAGNIVIGLNFFFYIFVKGFQTGSLEFEDESLELCYRKTICKTFDFVFVILIFLVLDIERMMLC